MTLFTNPACHSEGAERPKDLAQSKPVEKFHIASRDPSLSLRVTGRRFKVTGKEV